MPARLLAYGGTSFSERRRIGQWPAIPEATLRDSYGLAANTWCYGMGVIEAQPFLIFRQRQNVEQRGGYPFSLLLDPGDPVWERFGWNAATLVEALLLEDPEQLFRTPETCSADALERVVNGVSGASAVGNLSGLSYLIAASALEPVLAGSSNRPDPRTFAEALAALPVCFRASRGWLVGGGSAHGKALGASLCRRSSLLRSDSCDRHRTAIDGGIGLGRDWFKRSRNSPSGRGRRIPRIFWTRSCFFGRSRRPKPPLTN